MSVWNALSTILLTVSLPGFAALVLGCVWPVDPPPRATSHTRTERSRRKRTPAPTTDWTCALPGVPLSIDDAHNAMRRHRGHDCPRERVAYATLAAHGCLGPRPVRRPYRQKALP